MARRKHDFYPTPAWATQELLKHVSLSGRVFECCVGDGAISDVLHANGIYVVTNDIDRERTAHFYGDAADINLWHKGFWSGHENDKQFDWVCTNPPFSHAIEIVKNAHLYASKGVAMLLRLSFLEPTKDRGAFLNQYPPDKLIVLPRISFTGDGKTDNVTCAWFIWDFERVHERNIIVSENPKFVLPKAA